MEGNEDKAVVYRKRTHQDGSDLLLTHTLIFFTEIHKPRQMSSTSKGTYVPVRNELGRFTNKRICLHSASGRSDTTMKTLTMKKRNFKRRTLDAPRIGKKTSVVWHFFKALPHDNGISRAVCLLCKVIFKNPGGSTTGMRGHLERKHPGVIEKVLEADRIKVETKPRTSLPTTLSSKEVKVYSRSGTPPPPHLSIENSSIGEVGETEIFEEPGSANHVSEGDERTPSTSKGKQRILPGPPPEVYSPLNTEEITKSIVISLASSMQPLHSVDNAYFKKMLNHLNSDYVVDAGSIDSDSIFNSLTNTLDELYKETKGKIQQKLQGKPLSLSLELWVKTNCELHIFVTANYISSEWSLENCFMGMRRLEETCLITHPDSIHVKISQVVNILLEEFELKAENLVHVLFHSIPFPLNSNILSLPTWPCLNDTVRRGYDLLNEFALTVTSCDLFQNTLKIGKQVLPNYKDVKRHPGKLLEEMKRFLSTHSLDSLPINVGDLEECMKLQEPLNVIIDSLLEQPIIPASSILPLIYFVRKMYETQINSITEGSNWTKEQKQEITTSVTSIFETSYKINSSSNDLGDPMLAVCTFLDPRYKKLKFLTLEQRDHVYDTVTELLSELGKGKPPNSDTGSIISVRSENPAYMNENEINNQDDQNDPLNPSISSTSVNTAATGQSSKLAVVLSSLLERKPVKLASTEAMQELSHYWEEPVAALTMDPFLWWNFNRERFPKLAELAKRYLCIRGNSALSKLNFTGAGKRFYDQLANIESEFVEKLQLVKQYHSLQDELADTFVPQEILDDPDQLVLKTETIELMDEEV